MAQELKGLCDCIEAERFSFAAIGAAMAIVALGLALAALISGGLAGFIALPVGALLAIGGAAFAVIGAVDVWCSSNFAPWYALHFGG